MPIFVKHALDVLELCMCPTLTIKDYIQDGEAADSAIVSKLTFLQEAWRLQFFAFRLKKELELLSIDEYVRVIDAAVFR